VCSSDLNEITRYNPDIIGISVYNHTKDASYRFCAKVKKELPGVRICLGGYMPSYWGIEMMKEAAFIDYVVRGEGEEAFLDLVAHLEKDKSLENISGLTYRNGVDIQVNVDRRKYLDMDSLPFPARDIWVENKLNIVSISTSRGCLSGCYFCSSPHFWGRWRGRSVQNILNEIQYLYNLGARRFNFIDGSFEDPDPNCERMRAIAQGIIDLNLKIAYFADLRTEFYKKANNELMGILKKSGLRYVCVGIETANPTDHKLFGKQAALEDAARMVEFLRRHQVGINIGFINFTPYSTFAGIRQNIDFLEKYGFAANISYISNRYMSFKGSYLYQRIQKDGLMTQTGYDDVFGYRYQDERIMRLAEYLNDFLLRLDEQTNGSVSNIYYSRDYYSSLLGHYKTQFEFKQLNQALAIVLNHEKEIMDIFTVLNQQNASWFRQLLDLAETGWDASTADNIMNKAINKEYIQKTLTSIKQKKFEFTFNILSLGPEYASYLFK
jgi:radical SAM superfamily enzyme YgiQ (UPF0313 family)